MYRLPNDCVICHTARGFGDWQLCDSCRADLAERDRRHRATMDVAECVICHYPLGRPVAGRIYCRLCADRFDRRATGRLASN